MENKIEIEITYMEMRVSTLSTKYVSLLTLSKIWSTKIIIILGKEWDFLQHKQATGTIWRP
jgi:hypothetical protein